VLTTATHDQVIGILVRALSPYVGPTMASASVRGLCERFFRVGVVANRERVAQVIEALEPGLHVFVGKGKAESVVREMWIALDALGGEP
jgi:hypothetical protein